MKIQSLQISNILSFQHHDDVGDASRISFDDGLNIVIGENGSGKSTALEVINFLFKRVFYKQYNVDQVLYDRRRTALENDKRRILQAADNNSYGGFRLDPNWDTEDKPRVIRIELKLDDIDTKNMELIKASTEQLQRSVWAYTSRQPGQASASSNTYVIDVTLSSNNEQFQVAFVQGASDFGIEYLTDYNFFKESLALYNLENASRPLPTLQESFMLISSYRNYHAFQQAVSLKEQSSSQQMQQIKNAGYVKSMNTSDQNEPPIFALVRLRVAEAHFERMPEKLSEAECEAQANALPFFVQINARLAVVHLECRLKLISQRTWDYGFQFIDKRRDRVIADINSLSAGQKAIVHLVFEAFGRGDLKGGVVIVDEPEIHLHYQFQHEYLEVIRELNKVQSCQYILVTHSEALINSSTIRQVRRFALDGSGHTEIRAPQLSADQRELIQILDNSRSTYAFFARRVLLVEGETDRFFFKAVIQQRFPDRDQEIAVLDIGGKGGFEAWTNLFKSFGLSVHRVADLDYAINAFYPADKGQSVKKPAEVAAFKGRNSDWATRIEGEYANQTYILKNGDLEHYLGTAKGLDSVIEFCKTKLVSYFDDTVNPENREIQEVMRRITA